MFITVRLLRNWLAACILHWILHMAKAKKRVATRKKKLETRQDPSSLRVRRPAKHTALKKAKSKVQRAGKSATKPKAPKKRKTAAGKVAKSAPRQVVEVPVETTIIDVIEAASPRCCCCYQVRIRSDGDPHFAR